MVKISVVVVAAGVLVGCIADSGKPCASDSDCPATARCDASLHRCFERQGAGSASGSTTGDSGSGSGSGTSGGTAGSTSGSASSSGTTGTAPTIVSFTASANPVTAGDTVELDWVIEGPTTSLVIDPIGPVTGTSALIQPASSTTYLLHAWNGALEAQASIDLTVYPDVSLSISPSAVSILAEQTQQFTASIDGQPSSAVDWSVDDLDGGTVDTSGLYRAPFQSGIFHLRAASVVNPLRSSTAAVQVTRPPAGTLDIGFGDGGDATYLICDGGIRFIAIHKIDSGFMTGAYELPTANGFVMPKNSYLVKSNLDGAPMPFGNYGVANPDQSTLTSFSPTSDGSTYFTSTSAVGTWTSVADPSGVGHPFSVPGNTYTSHLAVCTQAGDLAIISEGPLVRAFPDAGIDPAFGQGGVASLLLPDGGQGRFGGCAVADDGNILGFGTLSPNVPFVARLTADGTFDSSFGLGRGWVAGPAGYTWADVTQNHFKQIYVKESTTAACTIIRLLPDGQLDTTFGGLGRLLPPSNINQCWSTIGPSDELLVNFALDGGSRLERFDLNGNPDPTFDLITARQVGPVFIEDDGKVVAASPSSQSGVQGISFNRYWP